MPYFDLFLWDEDNEDHVAQHGVTKEEFEFVVLNAKQSQFSRSSGRPTVFGYTEAGRKLCCVYEVEEGFCFPVTAYEVE